MKNKITFSLATNRHPSQCSHNKFRKKIFRLCKLSPSLDVNNVICDLYFTKLGNENTQKRERKKRK